MYIGQFDKNKIIPFYKGYKNPFIAMVIRGKIIYSKQKQKRTGSKIPKQK